jgi:hypothetical protein
MILQIDTDLREICSQILKEGKVLEDWCEIESDDMFQEGKYVGGFDATEEEFCFSIFIGDEEYWFQLPLDDIPKIVSREINEIEVTEADL